MNPMTPDRIAALPYEEAVQLLDTLIRKLEQGQVPLADSMIMYTTAQQLSQHATELLQAAHALMQTPVL